MLEREKSIFSVIDATPSQYDRPLQLWELAAVELWERYNNENSKYKKIELYRFINYFPIEEFKFNFFNEFEIYKKSYINGTIETFRKKEYQQFIYDCEDIIEIIDTQTHYFLARERGFDFYFQQMKGWKKGYIFEKNDIHEHELNLKALLEFINNPTRENNEKNVSKKTKYTFESNLSTFQINYLYTNYFSIYFDCNKEDIINLFSDNITTKIKTKPKRERGNKQIDIVYFFLELKNNGFIRSTFWKNAIDKTGCIIIQNKPLTSGQITTSKNDIRESFSNTTVMELVEKVILNIPKQENTPQTL